MVIARSFTSNLSMASVSLVSEEEVLLPRPVDGVNDRGLDGGAGTEEDDFHLGHARMVRHHEWVEGAGIVWYYRRYMARFMTTHGLHSPRICSRVPPRSMKPLEAMLTVTFPVRSEGAVLQPALVDLV